VKGKRLSGSRREPNGVTEGHWSKKMDEAMSWANKQEKLIEGDYYDGYSALRNLFNQLDLKNELNVMGAAYAVYGWMPTILKKGTRCRRAGKVCAELEKQHSEKRRLRPTKKATTYYASC